MKQEIKVFLTAIMFYTRIPCPKWVGQNPSYVNKSIRYFPLIGWLVGGVAAGVFLLGHWAISPTFGVILSFVASVLTTGALHEDGFADVCDGFGGGWTKDKILSVMKDSQIGAYGAIGLILMYLIKASLLLALLKSTSEILVAVLMICAHAISRFIAASFVFTHEYVRETKDSKAKPFVQEQGLVNLFVSAFGGGVPLIFLTIWFKVYIALVVIPALYLVKILLGKFFTKWIGGYTGDCLGATQQLTELAFYLAMLLVWKFTL